MTALTVGLGLVGVSGAQAQPGNQASASFTSAGSGTINYTATCPTPHPPPTLGNFWSVSFSVSDQYGNRQSQTFGYGPSPPGPDTVTSSYGVNASSLPQGVTSDTWTWKVTLSCNGSQTIIGSGTTTATGGQGGEGGPGGTGGGSPPPVFGSSGAVQAPPSSRCVGKNGLLLVIRSFQNVTYKQITVYVKGKRVKRLKGLRRKARIVLRQLPQGKFVVKIFVYSTSWTVAGTRRYHSCTG